MTGRERVKAALTFSSPDRAPRHLWATPYIVLLQDQQYQALLKSYPMDFEGVQLNSGSSDDAVNTMKTTGRYTDEWGSVWEVGEPGVIGEVKNPILADWSVLETFQPPWDLVQNREMSEVNRACEKSDNFMLSDITARPFERLQFLRGSENVYLDIGYGTSQFRKLLEMVHEYYLEDISSWCKSNVDGIFFMDDWGSSMSLLISPQTWRDIFKPLYRQYCDVIHAAGKFAFFHSDGFIEPIYGDLIEVGIDAINSQLFCMHIEKLAKNYKGKITFWGEIDRQSVLPFGKPDDVRQAVMRVRRVLDDARGGVIAQCEWGKNNPYENIETVYKAWAEPIV